MSNVLGDTPSALPDEEPSLEPSHKYIQLIQLILKDNTFVIADWLPIAKKGISLIYHLCSNPDVVMNDLTYNFSQSFHQDRKDWVSLAKLIFLLGEYAVNDFVLIEHKYRIDLLKLKKK